jgi:hypothetical protein
VFQALELQVFKIIEPQGQAIGIRSNHARVKGQWGVLIEQWKSQLNSLPRGEDYRRGQ